MLVKNFEKMSGEKLPKNFNYLTVNIDFFNDTALALIISGAKLDYMRKNEIILPSLTEQEDYEKYDEKYFFQNFSKYLTKILLYGSETNKKIVRKILATYFNIRGEIDKNPYDTFTLSAVLEEEPVIKFTLFMKKRIPYLLFLTIMKVKYDMKDIPILIKNLQTYGYENVDDDMLKLLKK